MAAPVHLLEAGIVTDQRYAGLGSAPAALSSAVADATSAVKRVRIPFNPRDRWITAARESCRDLADAVRASLASGALPVVVGGECTLVAGTVSGAVAGIPDLHLIYFDAHGDFNTLATTPSHYVGGMCLAHVCGRQVAPLLWPGARGIPDDHVALVGARDLDPGESANLDRSRVTRIAFDRERPAADGVLAFARRKDIWLHVDVDVVDDRELPAVGVPSRGGPSLADLVEVLRQIGAVSQIRGVSLCGYDPTKDPAGAFVAPLADLTAAPLARALVRH